MGRRPYGRLATAQLEQALNAYAEEGWRVVSAATAAFPTLTGSRDEMIVVLERDQVALPMAGPHPFGTKSDGVFFTEAKELDGQKVIGEVSWQASGQNQDLRYVKAQLAQKVRNMNLELVDDVPDRASGVLPWKGW